MRERVRGRDARTAHLEIQAFWSASELGMIRADQQRDSRISPVTIPPLLPRVLLT